MRRPLPALATTVLLMLTACGGGEETADDLPSTTDATTTSAPPATASPPPSTLPPAGTAPPRPPGGGPAGTAPPAPIPVEEASSSAIERLVGSAEWDNSLPIPASCLDNAQFSPSGADGINGGTVQCSVSSLFADTVAFVRDLNRQRRLSASEQESNGAIVFTYGDVARIELQDGGQNGTFLIASQQFPDPPTTTTTTEPLPPEPPPTG